MYHPSIIASRLDALCEAFHLSSVREHSIPEVEEMCQRLASAAPAKDSTSPSRPLAKEEVAFIQNELVLTKASFPYWGSRYCYVSVEGAGVKRMYPLFDSQEIVVEELGRVEKEVADNQLAEGILLNFLKARRLGLCLAPETRVLTADFRWLPVGELVPGTVLVGTDENIGGGRGSARRLRRCVVEAVRETRAFAYRLTLDTGRILVASAAHRFLWRSTQDTLRWRRVDEMRVGDQLRTITQVWERTDSDDGWFGGMLDGEGSLRGRRHAGGSEICVAQNPGPVMDRVLAYLGRNSFTFHVDKKKPEDRRKGLWKAVVNRTNEIFEILGRTRPTPFVNATWWEGKEFPGKHCGWKPTVITKIEKLGVRRLIDLQTSTLTFIAEGVVSHNSTISQAAILHRLTTQTGLRAMTGASTPDQTTGVNWAIAKLIYERLPWFLKPALLSYSNTFPERYEFANGSALFTGAGKAMSGTGGDRGDIGRGGGFSLLHLSELARWEDTQQIDSALLPTVPYSPRALVFFESSPRGRNNWWHKRWQVSLEGKGRFHPVFIPWYAEPRKYRKVPPADWSPKESTLAHARRCEEQGPRWLRRSSLSLTRDQLYWYETTREYYEAMDELSDFLAEYAADPDECFVFSGKSLVPLLVLQRIADQARPLLTKLEIAPRMDIERLRLQGER